MRVTLAELGVGKVTVGVWHLGQNCAELCSLGLARNCVEGDLQTLYLFEAEILVCLIGGNMCLLLFWVLSDLTVLYCSRILISIE